MIYLILFSLINISFADPTWKWANAIKVVEKHEFYLNNEVISKPKNSWQTLFAVLYHDSNLKTLKDCVFYKVPGDGPGILKIKTIANDQKCEDQLYNQGDQEWKDLKALQYSVTENFLSLSITNSKFEIEKWQVALFNVFEHPTPKSLMSSAEYRAPKAIYLTPYKGKQKTKPQLTEPMMDKKLCHAVSEDCKELSPSVCTQCPNGWYEIPNGCSQGPKYCGSAECGQKNLPACRRGYKYQRKEAEFSCRDDNSFAYCAKGLRIQCQGQLPYCI